VIGYYLLIVDERYLGVRENLAETVLRLGTIVSLLALRRRWHLWFVG
jgi:hypothetical protein